MTVNGYELTTEWQVSNMGHTARAKKGSKKYFLKRYGEYKMPRHDESTTPALYSRCEREFNEFKNYRISINEALSSLAGTGGNIILPTHWFVDDIYFIESTEFVDGLIEDEAILALPMSDKLFVMLTAAGALYGIHRKNMVHSDLKRTNILAARNSSGKAVAKIIDFDRSYFANDVRPDYIGGDQSFMSPELAQCFMYDMDDESLSYLSTKSDIFSLGLVFHNYLTGGAHPVIEGLSGKLKERQAEGKTVYCSEALLNGGKLVISGDITEEYLSHLLIAMLQLEPENRPTAQQVLETLKNKTVLPIPADSQVVLGEKGAVAKPAERASSTATRTSAAAKTTAAVGKPEGFCAPWKEHAVTFDEAKLRSSGWVASSQITHGTTKCYNLFKTDGTSRVFTVEILTALGFALKKSGTSSTAARTPSKTVTATHSTKVSTDDSLWEADSAYKFDIDAVKAMGYVSIAKATRDGKNCYVLTKPSGDQRFMAFTQLKILGYVVKK